MRENTYVVSVYSNFNGSLESEIVNANSIYEAFKFCDLTHDWKDDMPVPNINDKVDLENLKQYMFDNDMAVNIIRID